MSRRTIVAASASLALVATDAAAIERRHLAGRVPELRQPLRVSVRHAVFVADGR